MINLYQRGADWNTACQRVRAAEGPIAWCWVATQGSDREWTLGSICIRGGASVPDRTLRYGSLLFRTETLSPRAAARRMKKGNTGRATGIPQGLPLTVQAHSNPMWLTTEALSHKNWIINEWPGWYATYSLAGDNTVGNRVNEFWLPLNAPGQPFYPSGFAALAELLYDTPPLWLGSRVEAQAIIWLPDRSARFTGITYADRALHVQTEIGPPRHRQPLRVTSAWRCNAGQSAWEQYDEDVSEGTQGVTVPTGQVPDEFWITVSRREQTLDRRGWDVNSPMRPTDTDSLAAELEAWLLIGESQQLEFKETLGREDTNRRFAETVGAFANWDGGVVLLGVADDHTVTGFGGHHVRDQVVSIVRTFVEEYIDVDVQRIEVHGKPVYVIRVPVGSRPPYVVRGRVMVRANGSNREAKPHEIRAMLEAKTGTHPLGRRRF